MTTPKWVTEPDKFRRGVGLYVRFKAGTTELFPVDTAGGDQLTYEPQEIVIVKHDADGTTRRVGVMKQGIDWYREHVIAIPYDARKQKSVKSLSEPKENGVTHVQPRSRRAPSKRR